ncbi:lipid droplet-associated protein [Nocardia miyunensis]|uniref:lipid droplet-associated protein n=1 Tax=Nocardia miyunensis TaxID=282684 RepID=UPI0008304CD2|nr:lipid droplet-associated protein [Nocardia miyunensis]
MFRPPFFARVAAGAAVYALEEARRLPTTAMHLPITAISQLLQTTMHAQQFVTSLALKGDAVFDQLTNRPEEQPAWATFDEDDDDPAPAFTGVREAALSRFDLYAAPESAAEPAPVVPAPAEEAAATDPTQAETPTATTSSSNRQASSDEVVEPEVASRYDYLNMTLAQLRARLRMLSVEELSALLEYERLTRDRAAFVTMLTNRIATVQAK